VTVVAQVLPEVARRLRPHLRTALLGLGLVIAIALLEVLKPWPLKLIVDQVLGGQPLAFAPAQRLVGLVGRGGGVLLAACAALVVIQLLIGLATLAANWTTISLGQRLVDIFRADAFAHVERLSLDFHGRRAPGDLAYRLTTDTLALQTLATNGVVPVVRAVVLLAGMLGVMVALDARLTLVALGVVPVLLLIMRILGRRIGRQSAVVRGLESRLLGAAERTMEAINVVQAYGAEDTEGARFAGASRDALATTLRLHLTETLYGASIGVVIAAGTATVLWVGARAVLGGTLSLGDVLVFTSYLAALYMPIDGLTQHWGLVQSSAAGVRRVLELLDTPVDLPDGTRPGPRADHAPTIRFVDVGLRGDHGHPVLDGVDLEVPAGKVLAIVGPTGAGKTTLATLVPRLRDPMGGRVELDGVDVRTFRLAELRARIAVVTQTPVLLPDTLRANLLLGRPGASDAALMDALARAELAERVATLPQGLDTLVGRGGLALSVGEQLRVTIARALLRDAPILLLDEPTASLDPETEARLMTTARRLVAGRTTLVITHRLAIVPNADAVAVMERGRVVEQGGWRELLDRGGRLAELLAARDEALGRR
jgi:ATP-binding cassette subfamily B protein/subfamily B ATP-binding cassette protein MsbA